jgi:hypothetical protein
MYCLPSKETSKPLRAPAGGRALEGPLVWSTESLGSLVNAAPPLRSTRHAAHNAHDVIMAQHTQHIRGACLASVGSSRVS